MAWELTYGSIPEGMSVLHHCDNKACVRPDHLFLGTQADNIHDMWEKNRAILPRCKGEEHGLHKITDEQVKQIRERYSVGNISQRKLAKEFNIRQSTLWSIVNNLTRKI